MMGPTRQEEILREFLENPPHASGLTVLVPINALLTLTGRAYTAGVRDERERREEASPFNKRSATTERFDNLEYKEVAR